MGGELGTVKAQLRQYLSAGLKAPAKLAKEQASIEKRTAAAKRKEERAAAALAKRTAAADLKAAAKRAREEAAQTKKAARAAAAEIKRAAKSKKAHPVDGCGKSYQQFRSGGPGFGEVATALNYQRSREGRFGKASPKQIRAKLAKDKREAFEAYEDACRRELLHPTPAAGPVDKRDFIDDPPF